MATSHEISDDDTSSSSDHRKVYTYSSLKKMIGQELSSMETFVSEKTFTNHIRPMAHKMENIEDSLRMRKTDLQRTDCSIIFAGETSSGKSSIINRLLGEQILPTGVTATTTRVCRIKYSKERMISTRDTNDMNELERMSFQNKEGMKNILDELAQTNDPDIGYVDIFIPAPLLQGNVIIVDTPGIGDDEQNRVAETMIEYLPNALAFVFVLNVSAAGGFQRDRIGPILTQVKDRLNEMVSFSPKDVVFVMNKWDSLCWETNLTKGRFQKNILEIIRNNWSEVDDSCVLKLSLVQTEEYGTLFQRFKRTLEEIVARNKQKRIGVHLRFLTLVLDECKEIVSWKLELTNKSKDENNKNLDDVQTKLEDLENLRQEEFSNIQGYTDAFLSEVTDQFYEYIHQNSFKEDIFRSVKSLSRFSIEENMDKQLEKATIEWQQTHIEEIFDRKIGRNLIEKCSKIQRSMSFIKTKMTGVKYKPDVKITSAFAPGGILVGSIVLSRYLVNTVMAGVIRLAVTGITLLNDMDTFHTLCEKTFKSWIDPLTKETISTVFQQRYAGLVESMIKRLLDGDLKNEINNMKRNVHSMQKNHMEFKSMAAVLQSLRDEVNQRQAALNTITEIEII